MNKNHKEEIELRVKSFEMACTLNNRHQHLEGLLKESEIIYNYLTENDSVVTKSINIGSDETFGFSKALDYLKTGGHIRLKEWLEDVLISIKTPDIDADQSNYDFVHTTPYLYVCSNKGSVPWIPTQIELLSEEWCRSIQKAKREV